MKLNVKAFSLTCGILAGLAMFLFTWWVILFEGYGTVVPQWISIVYREYSITPLGSLVGLIWGLVEGLIGGAIFAWLYNKLACNKVTESPAESPAEPAQ